MSIDEVIPTHPVQVQDRLKFRDEGGFAVPQVVSLRAYEVYCEVFRPQPALVTDNCRGGFGVGELVAFLYAHSFPRQEWRMRVDEALTGMRL
jgi:hypothetical protein